MAKLFFIQAFVILAVGAVHITALNLYLYWLFPWLDVPVHFFGALWISLASMWILASARQRITFLRIGVILVAVSVGWEIFELWGGIPREANFAFDTALDLTMDALGGVVGYYIAERLIRRGKIATHEAS